MKVKEVSRMDCEPLTDRLYVPNVLEVLAQAKVHLYLIIVHTCIVALS